jgi:hypothetical protein
MTMKNKRLIVPFLVAFGLLLSACTADDPAAEAGAVPVEKDRLPLLIKEGKLAKAGVRTSASGRDVEPEIFWVSETIFKYLETALAKAQEILADSTATQAQVDAAANTLNSRISQFRNAKKEGGKNTLSNKLIPAGTGYARNSVNTTPFRQNSLVTHGNTQYISYFDGDGKLMLGKRTLGETSFAMTNTQMSGWPTDAHNSISIMVDGDGFIHVALNHHNAALEYYRSNTAGAFDLVKRSMTGTLENSVTYTEFYRLPSGDLLFVYRNGGSGNGDMVLNHYTRAAKTWTRVHNRLVYGDGQQSPYWQMYLDARGTVHLSWVFRRSPDVASNHDMYYAYSTDEGQTWKKKSNGSPYTMPITPATAEKVWTINENSNLMNQTSMTADENGNPYIATYWGNPIMDYHVIYHDGTQWRDKKVSSRTTGFNLAGGGTKLVPIARPRLVAKYEAASGKTKAYYIFRDAERGSKVSMYSTNDIASNDAWSVEDLTGFSVYAWEPSHDTELWKNEGKLHIFVQFADQIDGEGLSSHGPEQVYCLEAALE